MLWHIRPEKLLYTMAGRAYDGPMTKTNQKRARAAMTTLSASEPCPVCGGRPTIEHEHPTRLVTAARVRNAAIDAAIAPFKAARDQLDGKLKGEAFRDAMAPYERAMDAARDAAWKAYRKVAS
jgi:hypothetical protein